MDQAAATSDNGSDGWDTVHVTPHTAERDLGHITAPRCFVLHSTASFAGTAQQPTLQSTLASTLHAAADLSDTNNSAAMNAGGAPMTLPPQSGAIGRSRSANPAATAAAAAAKKDEDRGAPEERSFSAGVGSSPCEPFGVYRRVRVIHNIAPCLIRCTTEVGPAPRPFFPDGPPLATASKPASPPPPPQRAAEQASSLTQTSFHSTHETPARPGSQLAQPSSPPPVPSSQATATSAATTVLQGASSTSSTVFGAWGEAARHMGMPRVPSATSQQLQMLTNAYARSTPRCASKASSRRSHTSSSTLPESVILADPLEIIADDAISFVDIAFAAHVSVRGKGPVQFVNCFFGHHTTSQLYQQFVSPPPLATANANATGGKRDSDESRQHTLPKATAMANLMQEVAPNVNAPGADNKNSGDATITDTVSQQLSGQTARTSVTDASPLPLSDRTLHSDSNSTMPHHHTGHKPRVWGSPLRAAGNSGSGALGLQTGFTLPIAMRMMGMRRRGSTASNAAGSPTVAEASRRPPDGSSVASLKATPPTLGTTTEIADSVATSVLDIHGEGFCILNQCDLHGGCAGASLVCRDGSRINVTDSSFEGPSITWAAIEVRDQAEATVQFTNIQQVMGVGVLVTDRGRATVDSSVIECCGIAGVVATDYGFVSLQNTGVVASASGVCVSLSGSAEAQMVGCGFTTRFLLPRRAAGLMFLEHLYSLGAFRSARAAALTAPAQDSIMSASEEQLLLHTMQADVESLLGLWLLHVGAADVAFPTSSQSLVVSDRAAAVVAECEFTCTMRLPGATLASATTSLSHPAIDTTTLEENPSSNGSRANRSEGAVPSFTGLPPAAASVMAVMLSGSEANLSVTNASGLGSSGHNAYITAPNANINSHGFLSSGSVVARLLPGVVEEAAMRRSLSHPARRSTTTFSESVDGAESNGASPLRSGLVRSASRSSVVVPTASEVLAHQASSQPSHPFLGAAAAVAAGRAACSVTGTLTASTASGPPPLHVQVLTSTASPSSLLPASVRRLVAGFLSSYVMAREVFGTFLCEKRRAHSAAIASGAAPAAAPNTNFIALPIGDSKSDAASADDPQRNSPEDKTCTDLLLSFEALTEVESQNDDDDDDDSGGATTRLRSTAARFPNTAGAGRRLSTLSTAAMQSLQESLQQLGCLSVLMSPNGGVYHIVASHQASLVLSSSVLSLALPPQLMLTLPNAWVSAASCCYGGGGADAFSSTIRTTAAPFVAAVLDYREPNTASPAAGAAEAAATAAAAACVGPEEEVNGGEKQKAASMQQQQQKSGSQFCSIFTRSNVIQYECVSMANLGGSGAQGSGQQSAKAATTSSSSSSVGAHQRASKKVAEESKSTTATSNATSFRCSSNNDNSNREGDACSTAEDEDEYEKGEEEKEEDEESDDEDEEEEEGGNDETEESSMVRSIFGAGVSDSNYNSAGRKIAIGNTPATATAPRNCAALPPRPFSASTSAAQHPHAQPPQQLRQPQQSSDGNSSFDVVEFNTAAWGLVLVTPLTAPHSNALEAAVRVQAEHWCRVELTASQTPTVAQGDTSREASSTVTQSSTHVIGRGAPLEVPALLQQSNAAQPCWSSTSPLSRSASASVRTAAGSTSPGRASTQGTEGTKLDSTDCTEASEKGDDSTSDGSNRCGAAEALNSQVLHTGNIFLNMANQAELLSVTHPEHICTSFANFAQVMELPAAQEFLVTPAQGAFPAHPAEGSPAAAASGAATRTPSLHVGKGTATATMCASSATGHVTTVPAGLGGRSADADAPGSAGSHPLAEMGRAAVTTTATATTTTTTATTAATSACSCPNTAASNGILPTALLVEREVSRLHVNADIQRQMLLDDVDAPPLLAAAAARDGGESSSGKERKETVTTSAVTRPPPATAAVMAPRTQTADCSGAAAAGMPSPSPPELSILDVESVDFSSAHSSSNDSSYYDDSSYDEVSSTRGTSSGRSIGDRGHLHGHGAPPPAKHAKWTLLREPSTDSACSAAPTGCNSFKNQSKRAEEAASDHDKETLETPPSTYSSKHDEDDEDDDADREDRRGGGSRQPRQHSNTFAMPHAQPSSCESSPRDWPAFPRTPPRSRHSSSSRQTSLDTAGHRPRSDTVTSTSVDAASRGGVDPAALEAALARMTQLEAQLEQMRRLILVQQSQVAQMHTAFQQSSSSHLEMCDSETQPSLLALQTTTKSIADRPDHTQDGSSKDSCPPQSSSYRSSFSSSKVHSASGSCDTLDKRTTQTVAAGVGAAAGVTVASDDRPRPKAHVYHLSPQKSEGVSCKKATAELKKEEGVFPAPPRAATAAVEEEEEEEEEGNNISDTQVNQAYTSAPVTPAPVVIAVQHPPPLSDADAAQLKRPRKPVPPPPPPMLAPSPPLSPPLNNAKQSPPLRTRLRRPSSSTTIELLIAAAQHSLLGTSVVPHDTTATGAIVGAHDADNSTSLNAQQQQQQEVHAEGEGDTGEERSEAYAEEEDEQRWREALLRRLRTSYGGGGVERWRDRLPFASTSSFISGDRPAYHTHLHDYTEPGMRVREGAGDEDDLYMAANNDDYYHYVDCAELRSPRHGSNPAVAFEPWRTTVATGTRYAHRPPPHPYSFPALFFANMPVKDGERVPPQSQPPLAHAAPPGSSATTTTTSAPARSPLARQPHRPSSCLTLSVPYVESDNSSQPSPTAPYPPMNALASTMSSSSGYGDYAGLPGLYLSGRRRSSQRGPQLSSPLLQATTALRRRPPALSAPNVARLHEDHLRDEYARAAWDVMVAQSFAQVREQQRLTSPRQSAQVQRLYTEPMRERMHRAAAHARPTREQLYRLHGCTFTPKINQGRTGGWQRRAVSRQQRAPSGTARTCLQRSLDASSDSLPYSPSALPSNNTTMTCDETTTNSTSTSAQRTLFRRRRPPPAR